MRSRSYLGSVITSRSSKRKMIILLEGNIIIALRHSEIVLKQDEWAEETLYWKVSRTNIEIA